MSRKTLPRPKNKQARRLYDLIKQCGWTKAQAFKLLQLHGLQSSFVSVQKWLRGVEPSPLHEADLGSAINKVMEGSV